MGWSVKNKSCKTPRQRFPINTENQSDVHGKQLTKGKEGGEEREMSKQKTAIVPILHSKNRNCTQDDNCQGDEACTHMQRDFTQDL